jgi:hypothetical protein
VSELYRQRLFAVFTDGFMLYPVFAEVRKGTTAVDVEILRREVAAQYELDARDLRIVSYPRWAILREAEGGHVLHLGMIPLELPDEAKSS